jgi:hypothetical protein
MKIPINCSENNYFRTFLRLINPILKLKDKEIEVMAAFLLVLYNNKSLPIEESSKLLFSTKIRKFIRTAVGMSEASFNNHITALRKKKLIQGKGINPILLKGFPEKGGFDVTFNIKLNGKQADNTGA